ncbi:WXG100 family type VII secretion target [Williamsia sterculiae]|uniref:WXG100 family type VII secretion target n=1 Tax=Williamsia sterculiae TaxID=1344003 RepID=A0A1N7GSP6_9NOCA|nr:WXG100 family type VII secretion target [Williamsia sterculiae]SIS15617.1 WXG100 family type VII secretion target [Williamsia sterculiae]
MSDLISYHFGDLQDLQAGLVANVNRLHTLSADLGQTVSHLNDAWKSDSAGTAFNSAYQQWNKELDAATEHLHGIGKGVGNASDSMQHADKAAAARFGN